MSCCPRTVTPRVVSADAPADWLSAAPNAIAAATRPERSFGRQDGASWFLQEEPYELAGPSCPRHQPQTNVQADPTSPPGDVSKAPRVAGRQTRPFEPPRRVARYKFWPLSGTRVGKPVKVRKILVLEATSASARFRRTRATPARGESLKAAAIRPLVSSSAGAPWPAGPFSLWLRGPGANAVSRPYNRLAGLSRPARLNWRNSVTRLLT